MKHLKWLNASYDPIYLWELIYYLNYEQVEQYWKSRPSQLNDPTPSSSSPAPEIKAVDEDWHMELQQYFRDTPSDVTPETDLVNWWSVCVLLTTTRVFILY